MAVWGQGDPRWLVEHREDGKNVNGWHWQEESRKEWSKRRLDELLVGLKNVQGGTNVSITSLKEMSGEASITVRKGNKRFPVYDVKLTLGWEGQYTSGPTVAEPSKVTGDIVIEELISTAEPEDLIVTVSVIGTGAAQDECKRMAEALRPQVLEALATFVEDIHKS